MHINIEYPLSQTYIFIFIILVTCLFTIKRKAESFFSLNTTDELKGFSILTVIFGHIGYFLVTNPVFLFPLSTISGVGVNLFIFLSGYGLTFSMMRKPQSILQFYKKRISKIYLPLWISLIIFLLADFFVHNLSYNLTSVWEAFLGYFPTAGLFTDINSPLWFITFIMIYYLLFPILFLKKYPLISVLLMLVASFLIFYILYPGNLTLLQYFNLINKDISTLYRLHFLAFPLGMLLAVLIIKYSLQENIAKFITRFTHNLKLLMFFRLSVILISLYFLGYFAINSGVGGTVMQEQSLSLITVFFIMLIVLTKKFQIGFFALFGTLSYEVYLVHWPILSRYNFLYNYMPGAYATVLYLVIFLMLALTIQKISGFLLKIWRI